ncbi:hypothetical protein QA383_001866 [Escherichia coli]|nr:hypothetical protein [Escherichia coli]ELS8097075.1 hypothetical protein [Escherichia coli]HBA3459011.1 hypothetical protein [Escherichia coli]
MKTHRCQLITALIDGKPQYSRIEMSDQHARPICEKQALQQPFSEGLR